MHSVVKTLEKNIVHVPLGDPSFNDRHYDVIPLSAELFSYLPKLEQDLRLAFVDGGSTVILSAPNFAVGLNRLYYNLFTANKRVQPRKVPQRIDFYTICYAIARSGQIDYKTEIVPLKEEWRKYLPNDSELEFNSFDRSIMIGKQRAPITSVLGAARMFAEWRFAGFIAGEELEKGEVLVRDGSLQTSVTNESKYSNEAYKAALEKGVYFSALSKTSTLFTSTGIPLFSAIHTLSENSKCKDCAWYYYPIVNITSIQDHKAAMFAVKLHKISEYVFRFEVLKDQVRKGNFQEIENIISAIAENSKDIAFPGYPYGLIDADKLARVTMTEQTSNEFQLRAAISDKEVWKELANFVKSTDAHEILNKLIK